MNSKTKNKRNYLLPLIFTIVLMVGFGLIGIEKTNAEDEMGVCTVTTAVTGEGGGLDVPSQTTKAQCDSKGGTWKSNTQEKKDQAAKTQSNAAALNKNKPSPLCPGLGIISALTSLAGFNCILLIIAKVILIVVKAIFVLFTTIIAPKNITDVVGNKIIYQIWTMVRDVLNIAFIIAILFSAFSTIFQVQKYSYKNMLLNIVIMALLVNFSFPIARVIIDIANVIMYTFVQGFGITSGTGGFMGQILTKSGFDSLVTSITSVKDVDTTYLIALIIFLFIFAITLLILALLFVIRLTALAILVIFSPIAFVGPTLPFLSKYSSEWWDNLFKYSFFGPIMVFMLYIALKMMTSISSMGGTMKATAGKVGDGSTASLVASIAFFSIPIVILWFGMAVAQKMSIAFAGTATGAATNFMKGAGKKFGMYNWTKRRVDAYKEERKKRSDEKFKKNWGKTIGGAANRAQDTAHAALPGPFKIRGKEYDAFGSGAAQKRLNTRMETANKEAIKNKSEGKDGATTQDLVKNIAKNIVTPPTTKDKKIDAAAEVKQALSRGKEYEMQIAQAIRSVSPEMAAFINSQAQAGNITLNPNVQAQITNNNLTDPTTVKQIKSLLSAQSRKLIADAEKAK
jgi:hypothetical protein